MNAAAEKEHARMLEEARQMLNQRTRAAVEDGLEVEVVPGNLTVNGEVHEDASVEMLVYREIEP